MILPEKDLRDKLRFVCLHKGQGGVFQEHKTKKKGRKRGRKDEAHYFGYLCNFVSSKWYKLDDKDVKDVEENDILLDVRDNAYMLHYICYGSEEYKVCFQGDKRLHHSQEDTYPAISGDYLQHTDHPGTLNRELFATLSNAIQPDIIEVEDSDSDRPQKHPEIVATVSFQQLPEPSPKYALVRNPSAVLPTAALVSIPITQQLHEPSPKNSDTDTLSAGTPIATSFSCPMEVQKDALLTDSYVLTS